MIAPTDADLLPCPFCGARLVERGDYTSDAAANWWQHEEGSECIAADIRVNIDWNRPYRSLDELAWNRRAALAAMPRPGSERADALEECETAVLKAMDEVGRDWRDAGMMQKFYATNYLAEHVRGAIRALKDKPLPAQGGWQPIETAPKNGTRILAYWPRDGWREIVRWENDKVGWRGEASGYWAEKDYPKLWQHLPPPAEKADG